LLLLLSVAPYKTAYMVVVGITSQARSTGFLNQL
jgi:hypothetical protein